MILIDAKTGTILDVKDCYIVDEENLTDDDENILDNGSDTEIADVGIRNGISLWRAGIDTGWGDNAYRFSVSYSPLSLRDEADSLLEGGIYEDAEDAEYKAALEWVKDKATIDELMNIGEFITASDYVWTGYKDNFMEALMWFWKQKKNG